MDSKDFIRNVDELNRKNHHSPPKPELAKAVHEWRKNAAYPVAVPRTLREALDGVINALEAHRMIFLYLASARRGVESFDKSNVFGWDQLEDRVLNAGEHSLEAILRHKWTLDSFEQRVVSAFGPPEHGVPAGEYYPCWEVDDASCHHLEESSNCILQACEFVMRSTSDIGVEAIVRECVTVSHPDGQSRWYSLFSVNWSYLGVLNDKLLVLKRFLATAGSYLDQQITIEHRETETRSATATNDNHRRPFVVIDSESKTSVLFDPRLMQSFGPFEEESGWDGADLFYHYHHTIFLYLDREGHWTKTTATRHFDFGETGPPEAERVPAEVAVRMLVLNGLPVPPNYFHLVEQHRFKPGEAAKQTESECADTPKPKAKPVWDAQSGKLTLGGTLIRKVAETAAAVKLLLVTFSECEWESKIDSPFPDDESGKEKLRQTIRSANKGLLLIEFFATGSGAAVGWRMSEHETSAIDLPF